MSRSFGGRSFTTSSPMRSSPSVTVSSPATIRRAVDLPQPEGPTSTSISPSSMTRSSSRMPTWPFGYTFVTPSNVTDATGTSRVGGARVGWVRWSSLHRPGEQAPHEVALQGEEHDERQRHRHEGGGGEQLPVLAPSAGERRQAYRHRGVLGDVADERQGDEVVVPHPEELEDPEGGERRHRQRKDQPPEHRGVVGAVDAGRLHEVLRQRREVVVQQEDRQRQAERDVGEPRGGRLSGQVEVREHRERLLVQRHVSATGEQLEERD